jgi:hypothetical protein
MTTLEPVICCCHGMVVMTSRERHHRVRRAAGSGDPARLRRHRHAGRLRLTAFVSRQQSDDIWLVVMSERYQQVSELDDVHEAGDQQGPTLSTGCFAWRPPVAALTQPCDGGADVVVMPVS